MITGIGIDIIEKQRIKKIYKQNFTKRLLHYHELKTLEQSKKKIEFLSKTFTIKESLVKALGTGFIKGLFFNKISISKNNLGKPNITNIHKKLIILTSSSHEKNITIAITILMCTSKFN